MDSENMVMPVAPAYGGMGGGFGGNNGFGGDWAWVLLLLVLFGGWGGNRGGFGGGGYVGGNELYPWMTTNDNISDGFRDQMLQTSVTSIGDKITSGFGDVQTALCGGFAGVNANITNTQMANLERSFAAQTANTQGLTALQSQLASCCCENRLATANLTSTVLSENCADRAALSDGIRDIITNATQNTQRILDQLCADKIDAKNEKIADLERQLTMANLAASQTAQTAAIRAGQVAEIDAMYNRLRDCPVPTMPVYGSQPIFTCPQNNNNCGCGCNGGF